jgi:rubrerythrin
VANDCINAGFEALEAVMKKFLVKSVEIEEMAADVYRQFARNDKSGERLTKIWRQMAKDEEDHALALKLALRVPYEETFSGLRDDCPDPDKLKTMITEILERAKEGVSDEHQMLKDAVILENNFRKFHATYALAFNDESLLKTFKALSRADELHLKGLNDYLKEYKEKA